MGEVSSTLIEQNRIDMNWKLHSRTQHSTNILTDPNGRLAEERIIHLTGNTTLVKEMEMYNFRRTQSIGIVKIYAVVLLTPKYSCGCGVGPTLKVISQHLPYRLYSVTPLTQHEAIYVLAEALRIFRQIYIRMGPIQIDEDLFGFTAEGKLKVWCNPNFADNTPARKILTEGEDKRSEAYMAEKIIDIVEENTINRRLPNQFNKLFNNLAYLDFNMAQKAVAEYVSTLQDESLPDHVDLDHIGPHGQRTSIEKAPDRVVTQIKTEVQTSQYQTPAVVETITVNEMVSDSKVVPLPPREGHTMRVSFADVPYTTSFMNNNTKAAVGSNMIFSSNSLNLKKPPIPATPPAYNGLQTSFGQPPFP